MPQQIFSLEALNAKHGDALLLHYGEEGNVKHLLVDGGPSGVYKATLRPRLMQISQKLYHGERTPLEHVFVTHIDSDHIRGVLDFENELLADKAPASCGSFWFNTFSDLRNEYSAELAGINQKLDGACRDVRAVLASVGEGEALRDTTHSLMADINGGTGKLLFSEGQGLALNLGSGIEAILICPSRTEVEKLYKTWKAKARPSATEVADYVDRSVFNLSSLVVVLTSGEGLQRRRMLLTGDARGDFVINGLKEAGFLSGDNKAHFDLMKIAHHGSDRNYQRDFFKQVVADHYVISADGRDKNPSEHVLVWIGEHASGHARVHLTNQTNPKYPELDANIQAAVAAVPSLAQKLIFRKADAYSLTVDLMTPIGF